ncbi:hypothetical protein ElyMa_004899500 [Elysia marginata]|uniref:Reverse transcriptase domain-containing protein n=1 Tax=Elysia marginata TaxID=1093978 RepID=A0AAV4IVE5_9GAST|nr:hypothetical protein ElyMa_004899500 [Elysia marginata]
MKVSTRGKQNGIQWNLWQLLDDLDFVDDLPLLSHTKGQIQSKTEDLNIISKGVGLRIHSGKSKVLRSGVETEEGIILGTDALEEVVSLTYLGSIVDLKDSKQIKLLLSSCLTSPQPFNISYNTNRARFRRQVP